MVEVQIFSSRSAVWRRWNGRQERW